jgi:hypothetical protein
MSDNAMNIIVLIVSGTIVVIYIYITDIFV